MSKYFSEELNKYNSSIERSTNVDLFFLEKSKSSFTILYLILLIVSSFKINSFENTIFTSFSW